MIPARMIKLSQIVAAGAFGPTGRSGQRAGQRWVRSLPELQRQMIKGEWEVVESARLPDGSTVHDLLAAGAMLAGFPLPPGADQWTAKDRARFLGTHELLRRWQKFIDARADVSEDRCAAVFAESTDGLWALGQSLSVDLRAIRRYRRRVTPGTPEFDGNFDTRGKRRADRKESCSPEAWTLFQQLYLKTNQPRVAQVHGLVKVEAGRQGWLWPSLRTIQLRVKNEIPKPVQVFYRQGERRFRQDCLPKMERAFEEIAAGDHWVGDERTLDVFCRVQKAKRGWVSVRPKVTAWMDMRSRMFVGWCLEPLANSDTILSAFKAGARVHGLPTEVTIDNGEDYKLVGGKGRRRWDSLDAQRLGTVFEQAGVTVHYPPPYTPSSKPIESNFNILKNDFDRWMETFCGGSPAERPADIKDRIGDVMQLPTLDELREELSKWFDRYHSRPHSGRGINGLTPNLAMEQFRITKRSCPPETLDLLCCKLVGPVKVGRDGVRHNGFLYGQRSEQLFRLQGKEVYLRIDPEKLDIVVVCDAKGAPIVTVDNRLLQGFTQQDLREAAQDRAKLRKGVKEYLGRGMETLEPRTHTLHRIRYEKAKAEEESKRKLLPPVEAPAISIVRPDLSEAAAKAKPTPLVDLDPEYTFDLAAALARDDEENREYRLEVPEFDWSALTGPDRLDDEVKTA